MATIRGMFGAPVYLADAPDILGNVEKLSSMNDKSRLVDIAAAEQKTKQSLAETAQAQEQSQAQNRLSTSGNEYQKVLTNRLNSYIALSADNPELATKALNSDTQMMRGLNLTPGQYEFKGKTAKGIVVKDTFGGKSYIVNPETGEIQPGPDVTPPNPTSSQVDAADKMQIPQAQRVEDMSKKLAGKGSTRARTHQEVVAGALAGDANDAALAVHTGGPSFYAANLLRRAAGASDIIDPIVAKMTPKQAGIEAARLGRNNATAGLFQSAIGQDPAFGGTPDQGAAPPDTGAPAAPSASVAGPDGYFRYVDPANPAAPPIRTKDPNLAPPAGFVPLSQ